LYRDAAWNTTGSRCGTIGVIGAHDEGNPFFVGVYSFDLARIATRQEGHRAPPVADNSV